MDEVHPSRDPAWWVLVPATILAGGILLLAVSLRGMGVHLGRHQGAVPPTTTAAPPLLPSVWIAPEVPAQVALPLAAWVRAHPQVATLASSPEGAAATIQVEPTEGATLLWERVYVVAVPYRHPLRSLGSEALRSLWQAPPGEENSHWLAEPESLAALSLLLGPQGQGTWLDLAPPEQLADRAWEMGDALVFLPFERLEPRLRPLLVDGYAVLDPAEPLDRYPLALRVWAVGPGNLVDPLAEAVHGAMPPSNRDPSRFATLAVAGAASLTRGIAVQMDALADPAHPARLVAPRLSQADATVVGLTAPLTPECQPQETMSRLCGRPSYAETLRLLGADAVYLTDGRLLDYGPEGLLASLGLLEGQGWVAVGAGRNASEAARPQMLEVGGARVALLAYNHTGPSEAWAAAEGPGLARFVLEAASHAVMEAASTADFVVVLVHHGEPYGPTSAPRQKLDFRALAEAGADLVVGTQARQPQEVAFQGRSFLAYGLGNLVSDHLWSVDARRSVVVWCTFYEGRWLAVNLLPAETDWDGSVRWLAGAEARQVLEGVLLR